MQTILFSPNQAEKAAALLRSGNLVGIPTETVYGLGANGLDASAVSDIFAAKGRPQDNPLILHIPDVSWLAQLCRDVPLAAYLLADAFWPGPLTMILKCQPHIPKEVTAGLDTVGVRLPAHALCREIIRLAQVPIAAPSGNTSGKPSPTNAAAMLEDMNGKISAIIDGGACTVGVESTIVDLTCSPPCLLRPGGITLESLRQVLGDVTLDPAITSPLSADTAPRAPGMKYRHYAPKAPITVVLGSGNASAQYILSHAGADDGILCFSDHLNQFTQQVKIPFGQEKDPATQANTLFSALRAFDHTAVPMIWAQCPSENGMGLAVANRLKKAAGFQLIEV